jgi:hypothetical protein
MQYAFGSGQLFGIPLFDAAGAAIANPTPVRFGAIQDVTIDISSTIKELRGQNQFALDVGRGPATITGKARAAQISAATFNAIYFGQSVVAGRNIAVDNEAGTIPTTPFAITVSHSANFVADLGVAYGANGTAKDGLPLTRVASAPTVGQYSLSAGVYTFASADQAANPKVVISYTWNDTATGVNLEVTNQLMGTSPVFLSEFYIVKNGKQFKLKLYNCISTKLSVATKIDDYAIPGFDFSAYANASGQVMRFDTAEV